MPVLVVVAVIGAVIFFWPGGKKPQETIEEKSPAISRDDLKLQGGIEEPQIKYPVPQETEKAEGAITQPQKEAQALPALDESDAFIE